MAGGRRRGRSRTWRPCCRSGGGARWRVREDTTRALPGAAVLGWGLVVRVRPDLALPLLSLSPLSAPLLSDAEPLLLPLLSAVCRRQAASTAAHLAMAPPTAQQSPPRPSFRFLHPCGKERRDCSGCMLAEEVEPCVLRDGSLSSQFMRASSGHTDVLCQRHTDVLCQRSHVSNPSAGRVLVADTNDGSYLRCDSSSR